MTFGAGAAAMGTLRNNDLTQKLPVIAVDVDEVLCKFSEGFMTWRSHVTGTNAPIPAVGVCFKVACSKNNNAEREDFAKSQAFVEIDRVPGALEALRRLKRAGFRMEVVTSRPSSMAEASNRYLQWAFPDLISDAHFVSSGQKGNVCKRIGAGFLVDDQCKNVSDACKAGVHGVLFDFAGTYTWNHVKVPPEAVRTANWDEVLGYIFKTTGAQEPSDESTQAETADAEAAMEEEVAVEEEEEEEEIDIFQKPPTSLKELKSPCRLPQPPALEDVPEAPPSRVVPAAVSPANSDGKQRPPPDAAPSPQPKKKAVRTKAKAKAETAPVVPASTSVAPVVSAESTEPENLTTGLLTDPMVMPLAQREDSRVLGLSSMQVEHYPDEECGMQQGWLLKRRRMQSSTFARMLAGTIAQRCSWCWCLFELDGPWLTYWTSQASKSRGEPPRCAFLVVGGETNGRVGENSLWITPPREPEKPTKDIVLKLPPSCGVKGGITLFLRAKSFEDATKWIEALRAASALQTPCQEEVKATQKLADGDDADAADAHDFEATAPPEEVEQGPPQEDENASIQGSRRPSVSSLSL